MPGAWPQILLARPGVDLGVRRDPREYVVADERERVLVVDEEGVGRAVTWAGNDAQIATAGVDDVTLDKSNIGPEGLAVSGDVFPEAFVVGDHLVGHAVG